MQGPQQIAMKMELFGLKLYAGPDSEYIIKKIFHFKHICVAVGPQWTDSRRQRMRWAKSRSLCPASAAASCFTAASADAFAASWGVRRRLLLNKSPDVVSAFVPAMAVRLSCGEQQDCPTSDVSLRPTAAEEWGQEGEGSRDRLCLCLRLWLCLCCCVWIYRFIEYRYIPQALGNLDLFLELLHYYVEKEEYDSKTLFLLLLLLLLIISIYGNYRAAHKVCSICVMQ